MHKLGPFSIVVKICNNAPMIEVELRSFVTQEEYARLHELLAREGELLEKTHQETWYFDRDSNLRLVRGDQKGKICLKKGLTHDEGREEIEIPLAREDVDKAHDLLKALGHEVVVLWLRDRRRYMWQGIDVALDNTKGYGMILELELLVPPEEEAAAKERLHGVFSQLGISPTSKEEFATKYADYLETWKARVAA